MLFRASAFYSFLLLEVFPCMNIHNLFIHSPVDGYLGYFLFGAIMNKANFIQS